MHTPCLAHNLLVERLLPDDRLLLHAPPLVEVAAPTLQATLLVRVQLFLALGFVVVIAVCAERRRDDSAGWVPNITFGKRAPNSDQTHLGTHETHLGCHNTPVDSLGAWNPKLCPHCD